MQILELTKRFDELQLVYGDSNLDAIYGAGQINSPNLCLVFMNPTGRNVSAQKTWEGLKAPWIGTKSVWRMLSQLGLFGKSFLNEIDNRKPADWDYDFAESVYKEISENSIYITNLSKATQIDARPLKNSVFEEYLHLFREEMTSVNPSIIIAFGNQVSSVLLGKGIKVSEYRRRHEDWGHEGSEFRVFPVYYPVGQGMRNIEKAKEDIGWIVDKQTLRVV